MKNAKAKGEWLRMEIQRMRSSLEIMVECGKLKTELAAARAVVEASRQIRAFYPGGKLVWFDQFSAFETALAAYDAIREGKPCAPS